MLILLFVIGVILFLISYINIPKNNRYFGNVLDICNVFGIVISFMCGFILICILLFFYPYNVDKKLAMYEEENQKIETKIKDTVRVYMNYEQETYKNLVETSDLTTLLVAYPELNSNELVKYEIEKYKTNSDKIKEIKEQQIHKSTLNWWLYFGK